MDRRMQPIRLRRDLRGYLLDSRVRREFRVPFTIGEIGHLEREPRILPRLLNKYRVADRTSEVRKWWMRVGTRLLKRSDWDTYQVLAWLPYRVDSFLGQEMERSKHAGNALGDKDVVPEECRFLWNARFPDEFKIDLDEPSSLIYLRRPGWFEKTVRDVAANEGRPVHPIWESLFQQFASQDLFTHIEVSARQTIDDLLWRCALRLSDEHKGELGIEGATWSRGSRETRDEHYPETDRYFDWEDDKLVVYIDQKSPVKRKPPPSPPPPPPSPKQHGAGPKPPAPPPKSPSPPPKQPSRPQQHADEGRLAEDLPPPYSPEGSFDAEHPPPTPRELTPDYDPADVSMAPPPVEREPSARVEEPVAPPPAKSPVPQKKNTPVPLEQQDRGESEVVPETPSEASVPPPRPQKRKRVVSEDSDSEDSSSDSDDEDEPGPTRFIQESEVPSRREARALVRDHGQPPYTQAEMSKCGECFWYLHDCTRNRIRQRERKTVDGIIKCDRCRAQNHRCKPAFRDGMLDVPFEVARGGRRRKSLASRTPAHTKSASALTAAASRSKATPRKRARTVEEEETTESEEDELADDSDLAPAPPPSKKASPKRKDSKKK